MKQRDLSDLLLLAAIWGASFLFIRMSAADFGPVALAGMRVLGATALLLPMLLWRSEGRALRQHWRPILLVGITNSALPFVAFGYAGLTISGGLSSVFNATTPLWGALIAWLWLKDRPSADRVTGLLLGFSGVLWLAWDKVGLRPGADATNPAWALLACLAATAMYGFSANFTKRYLTGVPPMALAAGSQLSASLLLLGPTIWLWPLKPPSISAWLASAALALLCTGLAYVLFFRLVGRLGATHAMSVTFLIPGFAMAWGCLFLNETIHLTMLLACGVILVGTSLVTGLWQPGGRAPR